jgi:cystathionine gamma-synthase
LNPQTLLAQALGWIDEQTDALGPAIRPATTFLRDAATLSRAGRTFTRDDNPTFIQTEALLAALEGGEGCLLFSSGMAAATAVMHLLQPGAHVVVPTRLYSGLRHWLASHGRQFGLAVTEADYNDLGRLKVILGERPAQLLWIETPANPLWHVSDIRAVSDLAHAVGALVVADNTVATPILTRRSHGARTSSSTRAANTSTAMQTSWPAPSSRHRAKARFCAVSPPSVTITAPCSGLSRPG